MTMKFYQFIVGTVFCFYVSLNFTLAAPIHTSEADDTDEISSEFNESTIKVRLRKLNSVIDTRYTEEVRNFLITYIKKYRSQSELLLGRSAIYFPYFDEALGANKMAQEFKMVSVIESSLNPNAVSRAGAVGFWQFMPGTATSLGLNYNSVIDERRDAMKSADAAAKYLKDLYRIFEDWTLALAAYNCGPRRVQNAINAAGGIKDFWAIRAYLPRETQNYIPKFIAMNYVFTYYNQHMLTPALPELDLQITELVNYTGRIDLKAMSDKFNVSYDITKALNPAYRQGYVPNSSKTMYVILPARIMPDFKRMVARPVRQSLIPEELALSGTASADEYAEYDEYTYTVKHGDELDHLARKFNVSEYVLRFWNNLNNVIIKEGQKLTIFIHKTIDKGSIALAKPVVIGSRFKSVQSMMEDGNMINIPLADKPANANTDYVTHEVLEGESLRDIINEYGIEYQADILSLNGITLDSTIASGTILKIAEIKPLSTDQLSHP